MSKWAPNKDGNHKELKELLERMGAKVFDAAAVGGGFPDLIAFIGLIPMPIEIKMPKGKLRPSQAAFFANAQTSFGRVARTVDDIVAIHSAAQVLTMHLLSSDDPDIVKAIKTLRES